MQKGDQCMQAAVLILILKLIWLMIKELHISIQKVFMTSCMFGNICKWLFVLSLYYNYIWNVIY